MRTFTGLMRSLCFLGLLGLTSASTRGEVVVTFDELATRPLDGVRLEGVTFGFTIGGAGSGDATFNTFIGPGGVAPFLNPPNAEGDALGVVSFAFDRPAEGIQFGLSRPFGEPGTSGATVELFRGATSLGSSDVILDMPPGFPFPEALFTSSATGVTGGRISFPSPTLSPRFVLDNFRFETTAVPESSSFAMAGLVALGGLGYAWRRRRAA